MALLAAVGVGVLGFLSILSSGVGLFVAVSGRRALDAALADERARGMRERGVLLVDQIRHPVLRWLVNRAGAMAGTVLIAALRDRLTALFRAAVFGMLVGVGLIVFAFHVPGLMA